MVFSSLVVNIPLSKVYTISFMSALLQYGIIGTNPQLSVSPAPLTYGAYSNVIIADITKSAINFYNAL